MNNKQRCQFLHKKAMDKYSYVQLRNAKSKPLPIKIETKLLIDAFFMERECAMICFHLLGSVHIINKKLLFISAANLAKNLGLLVEYKYLKNYVKLNV